LGFSGFDCAKKPQRLAISFQASISWQQLFKPGAGQGAVWRSIQSAASVQQFRPCPPQAAARGLGRQSSLRLRVIHSAGMKAGDR